MLERLSGRLLGWRLRPWLQLAGSVTDIDKRRRLRVGDMKVKHVAFGRVICESESVSYLVGGLEL